MKQEQFESIMRVFDFIYDEPYELLTDYLKGVRDTIEMAYGDEDPETICDNIEREFRYMQVLNKDKRKECNDNKNCD